MDTGGTEGSVSRGAPPSLIPSGFQQVLTFTVAVEFLLLPTELVVELAVKLHLQHLREHQVAAGVADLV